MISVALLLFPGLGLALLGCKTVAELRWNAILVFSSSRPRPCAVKASSCASRNLVSNQVSKQQLAELALAIGLIRPRGPGGVVGLTLPMARADRGSRPVNCLPRSDLGQVVNLSLSVA